MNKELHITRSLSLLFFLLFICAGNVFCQQNFQRDVPFTQALYQFIDSYFDHKINSQELLEELYNSSLDSGAELPDEYSQLIHEGRCYYYYGLTLMENYDITDLTKSNLQDTTEKEPTNKTAARYFDQAIENSKKALKLRKGSDAYTLLASGISANCTAKNTGYIISNGAKVNTYASKAIHLDSTNGTARYIGTCQNVYAPAPFSNVEEGRKKMLSYLDTYDVNNEKFDVFNILSAIGYCCQRQKKYSDAIFWYQESLKLYPDNVSVNRLCNRLKETK